MEIIPDKETLAIVVVGYNRLKSIRRLLSSLLRAQYPDSDIPLVISIDCSGEEELYSYVKDFDWPYGRKYVNIQETRLGLKEHIYQCADLTSVFKAIILLEDDLVVSPAFYSYAVKALDRYGDDRRIAQISLYKNERNGYVGLPFDNIQNGNDVFLMQDVSTWGECWTRQMWDNFKQWRDSHTEDDIMKVDMPDRIKNWTRAWSKYYNAYVVDMHKYVLYPNVALTTNFSDAGEHGGDNNSVVQVNLLQQDFEYRMGNFDDLARYDIYSNNETLYEWLGLDVRSLCLDMYGLHNNVSGRRYILSTRVLPYKTIKSFGLCMRPFELNVKYNVSGEGIYLYDTQLRVTGGGYNKQLTAYFLKGFSLRPLVRYLFDFYRKALKIKLRL